MTKAFNNNRIRDIHHLDVKGLIDRDYLSQNEVDAYAQFGITTLNVAEVENLYLIEPLLWVVAEHMALNPEDIINRIKDFIFHEFINEQAVQLKEICSRQISFRLQQFCKPAGNDLQDLKNAINSTINSIDIDQIFAENKRVIDNIINTRDYQKLLYIYNRKSLASRVSPYFGLTGTNRYPDFVLKLLKTEKRDRILAALKSVMPQL